MGGSNTGKLGGLFLVGVMLASGARGQTPSTAAPAPTPNVDIIGDVTVTGAKRYEKSQISAAQRTLHIDVNSASSCGFMSNRGDEQDVIARYIMAVTGLKSPADTRLTVPDPMGGR